MWFWLLPVVAVVVGAVGFYLFGSRRPLTRFPQPCLAEVARPSRM